MLSICGVYWNVFLLFSRDDTPHVPDEKLGDETVLEIIKKLTNLIRHVFPGTK